MNAQVQFDLFKETTDSDVLRAEVAALKESHNAVRKGMFGRLGALTKLVMEQQQEIDYLRMKMGLSCILEEKI
jgi:hypothetical protein